jgi:ABC-type nitrate/sulfonate/bicarbonate transport system substrate-binding protein/anti-anti-sigma regulatory factor
MIPILCATPILYAQRYGLFKANGLRVNLRTALSWSGVKELLVQGRAEFAHVLSPMPFASRLGLDGRPAALRLGALQNVNGQAITLAKKHENIRDIRDMRGFVFGVPYRFSMQYYLLCDLFAKSGLDPLADIVIREVPPPRMPYHLQKERLDGVLAPEPFNQIIVERGEGFIYAISRDLWPGHPCCAVASTEQFAEKYPNTHRALLRSIVVAARALEDAGVEERRDIARGIAELGVWNVKDLGAIEQALTGVFRDGRGTSRTVPDRIGFRPRARAEYAVWLLSQMQRWGQLAGEVDYAAMVKATLMPDVLRPLAEESGFMSDPPLPEGLMPVSATSALEQLKSQPFSAYKPRVDPRPRYELPAAARKRIGAILEELAGVAGDGSALALEVTSDDEIGWLEQALNETLMSLRYAREAQQEKLELEERAHAHEATIKRQAELIQELSTPILPVLEGVLVLPIIGALDAGRGDQITKALLDAVSRAGAEVVLIDITGVESVDRDVIDRLLAAVRAVALLGAECVVVGVSPKIAASIAATGEALAPALTMRDLRSGIEHAMRRMNWRPRRAGAS